MLFDLNVVVFEDTLFGLTDDFVLFGIVLRMTPKSRRERCRVMSWALPWTLLCLLAAVVLKLVFVLVGVFRFFFPSWDGGGRRRSCRYGWIADRGRRQRSRRCHRRCCCSRSRSHFDMCLLCLDLFSALDQMVFLVYFVSISCDSCVFLLFWSLSCVPTNRYNVQ